MKQYLALDFGGSSIKYALVDEQARMTQNGKASAPLSSTDEFLNAVEALYYKFEGRLSGIAFSLPGVIDAESGVHFGSGVYENLLKGKNLIELIRTRCPVPVSVENDGKCGALAEAWKGSLADVKDGAVIVLGSGVGGGVIKDGKIHRGRGFTAGEFSFLLTGREKSPMSAAWMSVGMLGVTYQLCKKKNLDFSVQDAGETIAAFDEWFADRYPVFDEPSKKIKADGRQLFAWLEEGDPVAKEVYDEFLLSLALMVENIQICHAPDRIVIGGGLSRQERLLPDLQRTVGECCAGWGITENMRPVLCRSRYLGECNLLGAVYHHIQQYG